MSSALVVVDVQNDFCEGGSLAVEGGARVAVAIANLINSVRERYNQRYNYIVATKDWHIPGDSNGGHISDTPDYVATWPSHCIQGTEGAMFHPILAEPMIKYCDAIFYKGKGRPDYSGFQGSTPSLYDDVPMLEWLKAREVERLTVVGLATDFCVRETAFDAVSNGFKVEIPYDLTEAVHPENKTAVIEMIRNIQR